MGSGTKAGSYLRLIDFVYHSTLGLRVIKKKKGVEVRMGCRTSIRHGPLGNDFVEEFPIDWLRNVVVHTGLPFSI